MLIFIDVEPKNIKKESSISVICCNDDLSIVSDYNDTIYKKDKTYNNLLNGILNTIIDASSIIKQTDILVGYNVLYDIRILNSYLLGEFDDTQLTKEEIKELKSLATKSKNSSLGQLIIKSSQSNEKIDSTKIDFYEIIKYVLLNNKTVFNKYQKFCLNNEYVNMKGSYDKPQFSIMMNQSIVAEYYQIDTGNVHLADSDTKTLRELYRNVGSVGKLISGMKNSSTSKIFNKIKVLDSISEKYGYTTHTITINFDNIKRDFIIPPTKISNNMTGRTIIKNNISNLFKFLEIPEDTTTLKSSYKKAITEILKDDKKYQEFIQIYNTTIKSIEVGKQLVYDEQLSQKKNLNVIHGSAYRTVSLNDVYNTIHKLTDMGAYIPVDNKKYTEMSMKIATLKNSKNVTQITNTLKGMENIRDEIKYIVLTDLEDKKIITRDDWYKNKWIGVFNDITHNDLAKLALKYVKTLNTNYIRIKDDFKITGTPSNSRQPKGFIENRVLYLSNLYHTNKKSADKSQAIMKATKIAMLEYNIIKSTNIEYTEVPQYMRMPDTGEVVPAGIDVYFHHLNNPDKNGIFLNYHPFYKDKTYLTLGFNRNDNRRNRRPAEYYIYKGVNLSVIIDFYKEVIYNGGSISKAAHKYVLDRALYPNSKDVDRKGKEGSYLLVNSLNTVTSQFREIRKQAGFHTGMALVEDFQVRELDKKGLAVQSVGAKDKTEIIEDTYTGGGKNVRKYSK